MAVVSLGFPMVQLAGFRMENAMLVFVSPFFGTSNERSEIATLIRLLLSGWGECYMHLLMRIDL